MLYHCFIKKDYSFPQLVVNYRTAQKMKGQHLNYS